MDKEKRILIVDDDRDFREQLTQHLLNSFKRNDTVSLVERVRAALHASSGENDERDFTPEPYVIHGASQGQQAYEMVQQALSEGKPYALIFLDIRMPPGWDGVITLEHIWKIDKKVQVVLCSAHSIYSWKEVVEKFGKKDNLLILKKPFDTTVVTQIALALTEKYLVERNAETGFSNAEMYLDHIINGLPTPLIVTNINGSINSFNTAATELTGKTSESVRGRLLWEAFPELLHCRGDINDVIREGRDCISRNLPFNCAGQRRNLDISVYPMGSEAAIIRLLEPTGIRETAESQEYLRTVNSIYEAISKLKSDLATEDLNQLKIQLEQDVSKLEHITQASEKMIKKALEVNISDLRTILEEALKDCSDLFKGIKLTREFSEEKLSYAIPGNQLKLCCWNLLVNAAEAIKSRKPEFGDGEISVMINREKIIAPPSWTLPEAAAGEYMVIKITDNGIGIADNVAARIFEPFFSTKRTSGLGLVLVYNIMKQYNGHVRVESIPGKGSTFTLYLPV